MTIIAFAVAAAFVFLLSNYLVLWTGFGPLVAFSLAISLTLLAIALYGVRARSRLLYGLLELVVGFVILLGGINAYSIARGREYVPLVGGGILHRPPEGWLHWNATYASLLPVLAAIYVLVRGLDNVGEGWIICPTRNGGKRGDAFFHGGQIAGRTTGYNQHSHRTFGFVEVHVLAISLLNRFNS